MDNRGRDLVKEELGSILELRTARPYVFRTRLERALVRTRVFGINCSREEIVYSCEQIADKLNYVSDQSNQTSDGTLKSFGFLEKDIQNLYAQICAAS